MAFYMHRITHGGLLLALGLLILLLSAFFWFNEIISESTFKGNHTLVVRIGLKSGFLLFIASEIMLFLGFF
jgi:cytochrome c oxidase subunit 3